MNLLKTVCSLALPFTLGLSVALAQPDSSSMPGVESSASDKETQEQERQEEAVVQLRDIQTSLKLKVTKRRALRLKLNSTVGDGAKKEVQVALEQVNSEIDLLEKTFEQIAIGGIDLSLFGIKEEKFDWREELVTVVKPLIENVKSLTEKPRKIESLRRIVADKTLAKNAASEALSSIEQLEDETETKIVAQKLTNLENEWQSRFEDLEREIQLAEFQLSNLEGKNIRWVEILKQGVSNFLKGRGLTLLFVVFAAFSVWSLMRGLLWLVRKRTSESQDRSFKARYRLAEYGYRALTGILIAVAIMMVLYFRQDLLLLAVMVIIFIGAALALKNVLPKYVAEGRLLLNMGGVREKERVMYRGVPWEVSSINIQSLLTNPEIRGGIRLPISHMHEMISRPSVGDAWFPSSEGDWVIADGDKPMLVVRQSIDMVELKDVNLVTRMMPSADYYSAAYPNLSRTEVFRIAIKFGIDYATQKDDVEKIETAFAQGIKKSFIGTPFEEYVVAINADFESAGDSSLNYLMITKFQPEAAEFYNAIKRKIQRACVKVCNENQWGIPFPQVSVHLPTGSTETAEE